MNNATQRDELAMLVRSVESNKERIRKLSLDEPERLAKAIQNELVGTVLSMMRDQTVMLKQTRDFAVNESTALRQAIVQLDAATGALFHRVDALEEQQDSDDSGLTSDELEKLGRLVQGTHALIVSIEPQLSASTDEAKALVDDLKKLSVECGEILSNFELGEEEAGDSASQE